MRRPAVNTACQITRKAPFEARATLLFDDADASRQKAGKPGKQPVRQILRACSRTDELDRLAEVCGRGTDLLRHAEAFLVVCETQAARHPDGVLEVRSLNKLFRGPHGKAACDRTVNTYVNLYERAGIVGVSKHWRRRERRVWFVTLDQRLTTRDGKSLTDRYNERLAARNDRRRVRYAAAKLGQKPPPTEDQNGKCFPNWKSQNGHSEPIEPAQAVSETFVPLIRNKKGPTPTARPLDLGPSGKNFSSEQPAQQAAFQQPKAKTPTPPAGSELEAGKPAVEPRKLGVEGQAMADAWLAFGRANPSPEPEPAPPPPPTPDPVPSIAPEVAKGANRAQEGPADRLTLEDVRELNEAHGLNLCCHRLKSAGVGYMALVDGLFGTLRKHADDPRRNLEASIMHAAIERQRGAWT